MTRILVAFASKHHSTAEIAETIGEALREAGDLLVDVRSVETVRDITGYDAVILGSAVYAGQWQGDAAAFLRRHEHELAQRPTWLFSSGPTGEGDPETLLKGWKLPEALLPIAEHIKPRDVTVFHGDLESDRLSMLERLIVKGVKAPLGDFRDWKVIRAWASGVAEAIKRAERV
jgi:menaquinone-dependent protoporphyrinogen oxidase